jgi:hypothetical protein
MGRGPGIIGGPSQLKAPLQAAKSFNLAAQQAFDCIGGISTSAKASATTTIEGH